MDEAEEIKARRVRHWMQEDADPLAAARETIDSNGVLGTYSLEEQNMG